MKIFVIDARTVTPHFPGIGRYAANLAAAMAPQLEAGETLVILHAPGMAHRFAESGSVQVRLVESAVSPFTLEQQWGIGRLLRRLREGRLAAAQLGAQATAQTPMVYHSTYYLMPYGLRTPTVLTFYDLIPVLYPQYVSRRVRALFRFTMGMALNASRHVISISEAGRRDLITKFDVGPDKVTTAPLAADPHFCPQTTDEAARVRAEFSLPDDFLLYVGINKPHKNLVALIEAFAQSNQIAPATLVLAGPWDDRYPEAKAAVDRLQLGASVRFLGPIAEPDLPGLYAAATAFVFPSQYEGFGLPVLEALACGAPVACSNTSSLPEIAGDAALLFDPTQPAAIAEALQRLTQEPDLRTDLRTRGLVQAARFTWRSTAAQTLAVYRNLAGTE